VEKTWTSKEIIDMIDAQIEWIESMWEKFPPSYCGQVEADIQYREKDAKIDALNDLKSNIISE